MKIFSMFSVATLMVLTANVDAFLGQHSSSTSVFQSRRFTEERRFDHQLKHRKSSQRETTLFMSSTSAKSQIVYQKVVRPPQGESPTFFLGQLVEYLQDRFELPENLPMVYNSVQVSSTSKSVVAWDSPLSSSRDETQLDVEVVAIYKDDKETFPNMAMVVVSKRPCQTSSAPMMRSLFADSEIKIVKFLERGLDDFESGRIKFTSASPEMPQNRRITTLEEAIEAELMEESPQHEIRYTDRIIDTTAREDTPTPRAVSLESPKKHVGKEEFAVQAAKEAAQRIMAQEEGEKTSIQASGDYAVEAAKKIAAKRTESSSVSVTKSAQQSKNIQGEIGTTNSEQRQNLMNEVSTSTVGTRQFSSVISTPSAFMSKATKSKSRTGKSMPLNISTSPSVTASNDKIPVGMPVEKESRITPSSADSKRRLNLNVITEESFDNDSLSLENIMSARPSVDTEEKLKNRAPSQDELEFEISKAAKKVMEEIADEGEDMTAEEMLRNVMQFGEEIEKEDAVGSGFVSAAFEKAKTILQDQRSKREDRLRFKDVSSSADIGIKIDIADPDTKSPDDELKSLFEAGERLANSRIQVTTNPKLGLTKEENDKVDELIASDRTVSGYARSLDDELTELEVRISKTPGEEFDGPRKNPFFDILSGPEVYNPNVDPETAVNWPGAQPGTKSIRLPKELNEALKQAEFAAEVMLNMREVEAIDESGDTYVRFFVGDRELPKGQVENLRKVVAEGVKIGIIDDPLEYLAERSRLQMILDELWNQPDERFKEVAENYKDLLLSEHFVDHVKERLTQMADRDMEGRARGTTSTIEADHKRERDILGQLVVFTQLLLKETKALGAELEAQQIEVIRSICKVAMDPSHVTEEDTAIALSDVVRDLRPLFDDIFVAYLKYAVVEEEGRLARAGLLDDPDHNQWLFVLQIVQQGVYNEISKGISRYIDHIWYVLRMKTRVERRLLLEKLIDNMPTMDVRPFVQVVDNIVSSLGDAVRGDIDPAGLGEMTNKLIQLRLDVQDLLPSERIDVMARDADEWAARQKAKLMEARNQTQKRLQAAREIESNPNLVSEIRRRGETERFD